MKKIKETGIKSSEDVILARQIAREMAKELGFGLADQTRITTAVSELSRNIYLYAGTGRMVIKALSGNAGKGIEIVAEDNGPGIPDIEMVMQDGYSTGRGLGQGLPGTKRLMDEFEIRSKVGVGTIVTIRKWLK
ncbi:MAG: anti-sigma regulatory factor [Peptococcaceae bacterium]|nr:MAG: anti-sigma regulatory factor [Peptococcaceae bacterium]